MRIRVLASTTPGSILSKEDALLYSGKSAGICYEKTNLDDLFAEPEDVSIRRANGCIKRGHHSVFGHIFYSLALEGIPKILAMLLNNEKVYCTSEKSARYTHMTPSKDEEPLYEKWIEIYKKQIQKVYPDFDDTYATKLAQENARYLISIFTPATDMEYTCSLRQWNYIIYWAEQYIAKAGDDIFDTKLKQVLTDFLAAIPEEIRIENLNTSGKNRGFSLFASRMREDYFGEVYCTNYKATFSELAQAQRHKTINYEMSWLSVPEFFVPPIIRGTYLEKEWLNDIKSLYKNVPQGMLINVCERGTPDMLVLKAYERLCGAAQLEIARQTKATIDEYIEATREKFPQVYEELLPYSKGARCTFPGFVCAKACAFGGKNAFTRHV